MGGAEGYIADVSAALRTEGHESHLIAFAPDETGEPIVETTYAPAPEWPAAAVTTTDVISDVISQFRPDVAYVHTVYHPELVDWIGRRLPTVAYIHGPYAVCPGSAQYLRHSARVCPRTAGAVCLIKAQTEKCCWGRDPLKHLRLLSRVRQYRDAHLRMQRIIVGSEFMRQLMIRGGAPVDKIMRLAPVLIDPQQVPQSHDQDEPIVLYAGRLTAEKGIRHLIQALAATESEWRLLIAGDGPERQPCQALVAKLGLANKIEFLGWLDAAAMDQCYQRCAVVAFPSLWPEPFGRVGPEAFMHGRPVVAYATGGIRDWLEDGATGFLVPPGDVRLLGQQLKQILEDPAQRRRMGAQAQHRAVTLWNSSQHVERLVAVFHEALIRDHCDAN
jgi:glycosyltransferase involved in cell wall biosynthesis